MTGTKCILCVGAPGSLKVAKHAGKAQEKKNYEKQKDIKYEVAL